MLLNRKNAIIFTILALFIQANPSLKAAPCESCNQLQSQLVHEQKQLAAFQQLKLKNEEYLKKPGVPAGAVIKVNSNLLVISLKLETAANKIEAIQNEKKKTDCSQCKLDS